MTAQIAANLPIRPSTKSFANHEPLMALYRCWEKARGDAMVPTKYNFEGVVLSYPEILPNLTLLERAADGEIRYLYIGSDQVFRTNQDRTREALEGAFAPKVRTFVADWTRAGMEQPHISMWRAKTMLPSGSEASSVNLNVTLSNDEGLPTCIVVMTIFDKVFLREVEKGGYLIGSVGMSVMPVDIGCGIPNLSLAA